MAMHICVPCHGDADSLRFSFPPDTPLRGAKPLWSRRRQQLVGCEMMPLRAAGGAGAGASFLVRIAAPQRARAVAERSMSASASADAPGPSLSDFIHRSRVLAQYRAYMRLLRELDRHDPAVRADVERRVRDGFRDSAGKYDEPRGAGDLGTSQAGHELLAEGERQLRLLSNMVNLAASAAAAGDGRIGTSLRSTERAALSPTAAQGQKIPEIRTPSALEPSSGPETDAHVGRGWPWQRE